MTLAGAAPLPTVCSRRGTAAAATTHSRRAVFASLVRCGPSLCVGVSAASTDLRTVVVHCLRCTDTRGAVEPWASFGDDALLGMARGTQLCSNAAESISYGARSPGPLARRLGDAAARRERRAARGFGSRAVGSPVSAGARRSGGARAGLARRRGCSPARRCAVRGARPRLARHGFPRLCGCAAAAAFGGPRSATLRCASHLVVVGLLVRATWTFSRCAACTFTACDAMCSP